MVCVDISPISDVAGQIQLTVAIASEFTIFLHCKLNTWLLQKFKGTTQANAFPFFLCWFELILD